MFNFFVYLHFANNDLIVIEISPSHVFVLIGHLDFQEDFVSCSSVHVLTYPTNPWVDWEREWSLNFHDSVLVTVFLRHSELVVVFLARNRFTSLCRAVGMTKLALFLDQTQDSFRSHHVLFLLELSPVHGTLYALSQVDFVRISDDTRIERASHRTRCLCACADSHALHPGVGVRLSRTSTSSPSGLGHEGVALSLMTSEPLFSFSTLCPISFTTRCSSLSSVRRTHIDRNLRGVPFATTRAPPGSRSDGIKHSTIGNNGRIGDLYGLPVRRSNDVAPPLCG